MAWDNLLGSLLSPDDVEATYRSKGGEGHRGSVANLTETCDPVNEFQLINKVQKEPNNFDDADMRARGQNLRAAAESTMQSVKHPFWNGKLPVRGKPRVSMMVIASAAMTNIQCIHGYREWLREQKRNARAVQKQMQEAMKNFFVFFWGFLHRRLLQHSYSKMVVRAIPIRVISEDSPFTLQKDRYTAVLEHYLLNIGIYLGSTFSGLLRTSSRIISMILSRGTSIGKDTVLLLSVPKRPLESSLEKYRVIPSSPQ